MWIKPMRFSSSYIYWCFSCTLEKTGKLALLMLLIPVFLLCCQYIYMQPEIIRLHEDNETLHQQLMKPLPVLANDRVLLQNTLNETEYQQVKSLFDIFQQNHLQVDGSHYRFSTEEKTHKRKLSLDIPLQGSWAGLRYSLSHMRHSLVFNVDRLSVTRTNPDSDRVQINLQLTLTLTSRLEPS
jgi:hypothetical protein